jgi:hypothetical protein
MLRSLSLDALDCPMSDPMANKVRERREKARPQDCGTQDAGRRTRDAGRRTQEMEVTGAARKCPARHRNSLPPSRWTVRRWRVPMRRCTMLGNSRCAVPCPWITRGFRPRLSGRDSVLQRTGILPHRNEPPNPQVACGPPARAPRADRQGRDLGSPTGTPWE